MTNRLSCAAVQSSFSLQERLAAETLALERRVRQRGTRASRRGGAPPPAQAPLPGWTAAPQPEEQEPADAQVHAELGKAHRVG